MASPSVSILFHAKVSGVASSGSAGDVVIPETAGGDFVKATAAARGTRRSTGITLGSYSPSQNVEIQQVGLVDYDTYNLGAGAASWVRTSSAGTPERCTPAPGDDLIGYCEADGSLHLMPGVLSSSTSVSLPLSLVNGGFGADISAQSGVPTLAGGSFSFAATVPLARGGFGVDVTAQSGVPKVAAGALSFVTAPSGALVGNSDAQILSAKTYRTTVTAMGALAIDWSLGNVFTKSLSSGSNTITFSNDTDGQVVTVVLTSHGSGSTVTWPSGVQWAGGTEPTQSTPSKTDVYTLIKAGGVVRGSYVQDFS